MAEGLIREIIRRRLMDLSPDEEDELASLIQELVNISNSSVSDRKERCKRLVLDFIKGSGGEFRRYLR